MLTIRGSPRHILPQSCRAPPSPGIHSLRAAPSAKSAVPIILFTRLSRGMSFAMPQANILTGTSPMAAALCRAETWAMGAAGKKDRLNTTGTNHGSIVRIKGQWYVFYHRNTNKTAYSRQACAEPIFFLPDGSIPQVEITSTGLDAGPLKENKTYSAAICCNLTNGKMPHQGNGVIKKHVPFLSCEDGTCIVIAVKNTQICYKFFPIYRRKSIRPAAPSCILRRQAGCFRGSDRRRLPHAVAKHHMAGAYHPL